MKQLRGIRRRRWGIAVALVCLSVDLAQADTLPVDKYKDWSLDREVFVRMRDGINLSTTIVRPVDASGRLPTILVRAPYDDTSKIFDSWLWLDLFVKQGYAVVLQDERGRGFSEGHYKNYLQNAGADGYDTIDWIIHQPWSNGKVGTIGCSSTGEQQWPIAVKNHPAHRAMLPAASGTAVGSVPHNSTQGGFYRGGVPMLGLWAQWYGNAAPSERLVPPPNSTQEERIRLRNSFSKKFLWWASPFDPSRSGTVDPSLFMPLPSKDALRRLGGVLSPFDRYITWTPGDLSWNDIELVKTGAEPRVPALHLTTWHDGFAVESTRLFKYLQDMKVPNQFLIVGAGSHCSPFGKGLSDLKFGDIGADARYGGSDQGYQKLFLDWFGYWLNGEQNDVVNMPKVQLYVMGKGWISSDQWPPKGVYMQKFYLGNDDSSQSPSQPKGLSIDGPGHDRKDIYIYDPAAPVHGIGGTLTSAPGPNGPARDQRPIMLRKDVLVYRTMPLVTPVTVSGPVEITLYVSSSARDTDFMVTLLDIFPDGKAINLADDAFRMRYRVGFNRKDLMTPGSVYKITLSNMVTGIRFEERHRIGIEVMSSNFPLYERNLNTGGNNFDEATWVVAENSVYHGKKYPSHVSLPVLAD